MTTTKIFKHRQTDKCNKATKRQIRRRDVEMTGRCGDMEFSLEGEEGDEMVEGVAMFRCL